MDGEKGQAVCLCSGEEGGQDKGVPSCGVRVRPKADLVPRCLQPQACLWDPEQVTSHPGARAEGLRRHLISPRVLTQTGRCRGHSRGNSPAPRPSVGLLDPQVTSAPTAAGQEQDTCQAPATAASAAAPSAHPRAEPRKPHRQQALLAILGHTHPLDGPGLSGLGSQTWDARLCRDQAPATRRYPGRVAMGMRLGPWVRPWGLSIWRTAGLRSRI